ncbi:MAG: adenylate/guanylate cyclase domain-containing protein [Treponema sp.]|jgi:adenylate cyclase|nr:adenylate/guanylate cyclase domain-containing protein [Treponema sp.]
MLSRKISLLIAIASALVFSFLYLAPFFNAAELRIYDLFLRLAPRRDRIDTVVFLDVDDPAIAKIGVFPWPRRVMAESLLRLKEFNAGLVIFDIEYIDKSPTHVDEVYLKEGRALDYDRHFSEIGTTVADILGAVSGGRIPPERAAHYVDEITEIIAAERDALYRDTMKITGDDDLLLAQSAALFGNAWGTVNIQEVRPLSGEQAQRRPLAEQRFSYPLKNIGGIGEGKNIDVLPPIPLFTEAVRGAGFTNITVDGDGVRRRIFLAQEAQGHWYLQLAFAPLMASWGNPAIIIEPRRLIIEKPGEKDILVPLDEEGAMLLDWPPETYENSYSHVSFARFTVLEEYQAHIEQYLAALEYSNTHLFPALSQNAKAILKYFDAARAEKNKALEHCSNEAFEQYIALRNKALELTGEFIAVLAAENYIARESRRVMENIAANDTDISAAVLEEMRYCQTLLDYIGTELNAFAVVHQELSNTLNGKWCVIGRMDTGTTDIGVTPFHGKYVNMGTHAVVLDTILSASFITPLPVWWSVLFAFIFVSLFITATNGGKSGLRIALGTGGVLLCLVLPLCLFTVKRFFLGPLGPVLTMTAAVIVRETIAFVSSENEKQFIRKAFSTYVSGDVVKELIADPSRLQLGGTKHHMTALFTDIQKFSGISEKLDPEDLVSLLNRYLTAMSDVILNEKGTIDKYEGDAIIAFFGAPLEIPDHALRACVSAITMKRVENELNKTIREQNLSPAPLLTRIGINTGNMVVGNMGTENKMNYTIMGNTVNLAARLEGVNKQYGTWILASEDTIRETGDRLLTRKLDRVRVVGINEPIRLYELLETVENAVPQQKRLVGVFHQALDFFENRNWNQAIGGFREALSIVNNNDLPAQKYLDRCINCLVDPPPDTWDGVYNLTEK